MPPKHRYVESNSATMPKITFRKGSQTIEGEVRRNTNLVVRAGIKQFPYPLLSYECGMGKCGKCACKVLKGAEHLAEPNWKEKQMLGERLHEGYRLVCQLWIEQDIELSQEEHTTVSLA
jgi:ferredoxin